MRRLVTLALGLSLVLGACGGKKPAPAAAPPPQAAEPPATDEPGAPTRGAGSGTASADPDEGGEAAPK